jgi:hypothetical protein
MFDGRQCENGNNKALFFISIKNIGIFEEKGKKSSVEL